MLKLVLTREFVDCPDGKLKVYRSYTTDTLLKIIIFIVLI